MAQHHTHQLSKLIFACLFISPALPAQDLAETFRLALANDPKLKEADANQLAVGESKPQSVAQFLPTISSIGSATLEQINNQNPNSFLKTQSFWNNSLSFNLNQPIFHWEHWIQLSQSDNQIAQAEAEYKAELQNLMGRTTEAYLNVLLAQDNLAFSQAEKASVYQQLQQSQRLFANHLIPVTDVDEATAGYQQAVANEIDAANKVDDAKDALREIIGETDITLKPLQEAFPMPQPEPKDPSQWIKAAESANFTVIAAINQAESLRKSIELQRSGHYPTLDLVGGYTFSDVGSNFGIRGDRESIGVQLNVPIFAGGAVNSKTQQAAYRFEAAKENLNAVKRAVSRQAKDAYRGILTSIRQIEALRAAVQSSEKALASTESGFEEGTRTMVDVLNEQRNLYQTKREYTRARYDYFINSIKLKQAASSLEQNDLEQINRFLQNTPAPASP